MLSSTQCPELPPADSSSAQRYFDILGAGSVYIQSFDDQGRNPRLAQTLRGSLGDLWPRLARLNRAGAGIFSPVNEIAPGKPRKTENVIRVRALFADADDPTRLAEIEAAIGSFGLPPSMVIETSPGRRHYYWCCDDCPLERFTEAQKALAAKLGTDPAVCDLPRVMRVPGFYHMKREPFLVRVVAQ